MRRLRSLHVPRLLAGLIAVWCLGCQSFDVILERLLEDRGETPSVVVAESGAAAQPATAGSLSEIAPHSDGCCALCVAVQPVACAIDTSRHESPRTTDATPQSPVSVHREPAVPPPISARA